MSLEHLRWRLREKVRAIMLTTNEGHPLRRAYRILRQVPGVSRAWRMLGTDDSWRDVARYAAQGGVFAALPKAEASPPVPAFGGEAYFDALATRIKASAISQPVIRRRIILVNSGLSAGGAERQIVYTLQGLKALGHDVRFIGELMERAPGLDFHAPGVIAAGIPIEPMRRQTAPGQPIYAHVTRPVAEALAAAPADFMIDVLDMVATLRELRPEVIHLWQDETSTKHAFAALIAGVPRIVLSGRNLNPTHFEFYQSYMHGAYRALSKVDPVIVFTNNTSAGARSYEAWLDLPPKQIGVILNAFDLTVFKRASPAACNAFRAAHGIDASRPVIAGVFRLSPEKRPGLWIDAAAEVVRQRSDIQFVVAGSGKMQGELLKRLRDDGLDGSILLLGETREVAALYAAADLFFLASSEEGAPNVLIEAQASGLFSVVTDAGGVAETVEDGITAQVVVDPTPEKLAAALLANLEDGQRRARAAQAGPVLVASRFGMTRMIEETLAAYGLLEARTMV